MENNFYHIRLPALNVNTFITYVRRLRNWSYDTAHPHDLISLNLPPEETLDSWLSIEGPLKTLTRLCGCTG